MAGSAVRMSMERAASCIAVRCDGIRSVLHFLCDYGARLRWVSCMYLGDADGLLVDSVLTVFYCAVNAEVEPKKSCILAC